MSTPQWFAEFERQEAMREDRLDDLRARMSDGPKPPRYEARTVTDPLGPTVYGVFDTFAQAFCINIGGEAYSSMARAAVAASRLNGAYDKAMQP